MVCICRSMVAPAASTSPSVDFSNVLISLLYICHGYIANRHNTLCKLCCQGVSGQGFCQQSGAGEHRRNEGGGKGAGWWRAPSQGGGGEGWRAMASIAATLNGGSGKLWGPERWWNQRTGSGPSQFSLSS